MSNKNKTMVAKLSYELLHVSLSWKDDHQKVKSENLKKVTVNYRGGQK